MKESAALRRQLETFFGYLIPILTGRFPPPPWKVSSRISCLSFQVIGIVNFCYVMFDVFYINLALETDLEPKSFYDFLDKFKNKRVTVNYDSGNSASLGYPFEEELNLYGDKITNVHIKDRIYNGGPVFLGEGDAELKNVKSLKLSNRLFLIVILLLLQPVELRLKRIHLLRMLKM